MGIQHRIRSSAAALRITLHLLAACQDLWLFTPMSVWEFRVDWVAWLFEGAGGRDAGSRF